MLVGGWVITIYFFKENQNPSPWVINLLINDSQGIKA